MTRDSISIDSAPFHHGDTLRVTGSLSVARQTLVAGRETRILRFYEAPASPYSRPYSMAFNRNGQFRQLDYEDNPVPPGTWTAVGQDSVETHIGGETTIYRLKRIDQRITITSSSRMHSAVYRRRLADLLGVAPDMIQDVRPEITRTYQEVRGLHPTTLPRPPAQQIV